MPWLVRDGKVLATIEVATSWRERTRGLLGRDGIDGAILLRPAKSVHTFRMRFPIDVAFCDRDLKVLKVLTLRTNRVTVPVVKAHAVIESEAGTMARWGVCVGDQLDIRGLDDIGDHAPPGSDAGAGGADGSTPAGNGGPTRDADAVIDVRDRPIGTDPPAPRGRAASADVAPDVDGGRA